MNLPKEQLDPAKEKLIQDVKSCIENFEYNTGLKVVEIPIVRQAHFTSFDELRFSLSILVKL